MADPKPTELEALVAVLTKIDATLAKIVHSLKKIERELDSVHGAIVAS